jgi:hypothetical protein
LQTVTPLVCCQTLRITDWPLHSAPTLSSKKAVHANLVVWAQVGAANGLAEATGHPATAQPLGPRGSGGGGECAAMLLLSDSRAVKNLFLGVLFKLNKTPHEFFLRAQVFQRPWRHVYVCRGGSI